LILRNSSKVDEKCFLHTGHVKMVPPRALRHSRHEAVLSGGNDVASASAAAAAAAATSATSAARRTHGTAGLVAAAASAVAAAAAAAVAAAASAAASAAAAAAAAASVAASVAASAAAAAAASAAAAAALPAAAAHADAAGGWQHGPVSRSAGRRCCLGSNFRGHASATWGGGCGLPGYVWQQQPTAGAKHRHLETRLCHMFFTKPTGYVVVICQ